MRVYILAKESAGRDDFPLAETRANRTTLIIVLHPGNYVETRKNAGALV